MKLAAVLFTRLGGISRLTFIYRMPDGSHKTVISGLSRRGKNEHDIG
jgi:hypothetical protein